LDVLIFLRDTRLDLLLFFPSGQLALLAPCSFCPSAFFRLGMFFFVEQIFFACEINLQSEVSSLRARWASLAISLQKKREDSFFSLLISPTQFSSLEEKERRRTRERDEKREEKKRGREERGKEREREREREEKRREEKRRERREEREHAELGQFSGHQSCTGARFFSNHLFVMFVIGLHYGKVGEGTSLTDHTSEINQMRNLKGHGGQGGRPWIVRALE